MIGTILVLGTAGSGKTSLVKAYGDHLRSVGVSYMLVNFDPAVSTLPYNPDLDVRDFVSISRILEREALGPNGAIIAAVDLAATHLAEISKSILDEDPDYVIVDTPGQLEIFAFRSAGPMVVNEISHGQKVSLFLLDPALAQEPADLASLLLLSTSSTLRLGLNTLNILSKADLLREEERDKLLGYFEEPEALGAELRRSKGMARELAAQLLDVVFLTGGIPSPLLVSAEEYQGLEELHGEIQRQFLGGEVEDAGRERE
jgi:GTPase SAR1 family protein